MHTEFAPGAVFINLNLLQDVSQRKIRFTTTHPPKDLFDKIERPASEMGFQVHRGHGKVSTGLPSIITLYTCTGIAANISNELSVKCMWFFSSK